MLSWKFWPALVRACVMTRDLLARAARRAGRPRTWPRILPSTVGQGPRAPRARDLADLFVRPSGAFSGRSGLETRTGGACAVPTAAAHTRAGRTALPALRRRCPALLASPRSGSLSGALHPAHE